MKVNFIVGVKEISLSIFSKEDVRTTKISSDVLLEGLSNLLPNPVSSILLCQLPWIKDIAYRNIPNEVSLSYNVLCNGSYLTVLIQELDDDIIQLFNKFI